MKLIKPSFEILKQQASLEGIYKHIELCGRTCYKSQDKITEDSYKKFFEMIKDRGHLSVTEHGTVYLFLPFEEKEDSSTEYYRISERYHKNKYSKCNIVNWENAAASHHQGYYITTNMRVLIENNWLDDLKYLCKPTEYHEKRVSVRVICSIGISREWNRHRISISEQSTRYCNYSLDKFNNEITCIQPMWFKHDLSGNSYKSNIEVFAKVPSDNYAKGEEAFIQAMISSELYYFNILEEGFKPQQARDVLPLDTATEVIYTAYTSEWEHFFELRTAGGAHPEMRRLVIPLKEEFIERNFIK